jgi:hypothetical protein
MSTRFRDVPGTRGGFDQASEPATYEIPVGPPCALTRFHFALRATWTSRRRGVRSHTRQPKHILGGVWQAP